MSARGQRCERTRPCDDDRPRRDADDFHQHGECPPRICVGRIPLFAMITSEAELEHQKSFQVLKNYVCAAIDCISDVHGSLDPASLLEAQRSLPAYTRIRRRELPDHTALRQALILSWASRLQLGLAELADQDAVIAYANAWAPVHAYYSVYGAVRAWSIAQGQPLNDHAAALKTISQAAAVRRTLPQPWCVGCVAPLSQTPRDNAETGADCSVWPVVCSKRPQEDVCAREVGDRREGSAHDAL